MAFLFGKLADRKKTDAPSPDITEPPSPPPPKPKPPPPGTLLTHEDRLDLLVSDISSRAPPRLAEAILKAAPVLTPVAVVLIKVLNVVGPVYIRLFSLVYAFLAALPYDLFQAAMGLGLCFFGGGYCASIAAAEAFYMTGWSTTRQQLQHIYEEAVAMSEAQTKDDAKDEDGDGIADVNQIPTSELLERKVRVAAGAVRDPQRLSAALGGLYVGWLSVQGVLRVQFAKTINLALSCSQCVAASCAPVHSRPPSPTSVLCGRFVEYYVCKLLLPLVAPLLSTEFRAWLPVGIKTGTKASLRLVSLPTHTHTHHHTCPHHTIPYHTILLARAYTLSCTIPHPAKVRTRPG